MSDNIDVVWTKFFSARGKTLWEKFPGIYRAQVMETNDPLNIGRIKFKCPDLHDFDLTADDCPWAVVANDMGGKKAGRFAIPVIGDWVWITFERQHPYGPVVVGTAPPTRRKYYALPQIANISPVPVNEDGRPDTQPEDYNLAYLPKDGRPMVHGWVDRYGHMDVHSSVGYFPSEHAQAPPPPDYDAIQGAKFKQQSAAPEINNPDLKYMVRITKYGHMFLMGDQGYHWHHDPEEDEELGEFTGNAEADDKFEQKRWRYVQKLINDNVPKASDPSGDQRKMVMLTRYGSRIEMRDAGWAQKGPIESRSRANEFGPRRILSSNTTEDFRWIKIRTKGGMLFQAYDKGFHPDEDAFIKRPVLQESGPQSEQEDKHWGGRKDARFIRIVTRYGLKFVLDDRGSDERNADKRESPRGNGILIKGRRTPSAKAREATGDPRGFFWEFNENDQANHSMWGSPMGQAVEMNDRYQYMMMAVSMGKGWAPKHRGLKENEFIRKPMMLRDPESNTHHLKLDHDNEYIRLKTRGGRGIKPETPANPSGVRDDEIQQGLEVRDGRNGDGPWMEIVDCQHRGMWFSKTHRIGVWRARRGKLIYQWIDDRQNKISLFNNEQNGTIDIYAGQSINIISNGNINMRADGHIMMRAGRSIRFQADTTYLTLTKNVSTNTTIHAERINAYVCGVMPGPGGGCPNPAGVAIDRIESPTPPEFLEPTDRGVTYNGPFEECPQEEVEHEIRD